ncbi:MAG: ComF family protein, partial [Parcubacteria group bacterium]|nr:ComF family protein [Parcubacteria group bacterium]
QKCFRKIEIKKKQSCPKCFTKNKDGAYCDKCSVCSKMRGVVIAGTYEDKLLQKAVHILKYKYVKDLCKPLAIILQKGFIIWHKHNRAELENIILIPVPLHKKKENKRGFNQAELLARALSLKIGVGVNNNILKRIKHTKAQAKQDSLIRRKNIKGAFAVEESTNLENKIVFIIDDVCTTSSTLEECAKEIDKLNPKEIWGLVLARGQ